jgi:uncharacterized membrane protein
MGTVIILLLCTFLWNTQITNTSNNVKVVATNTISSIPDALDINARDGIITQVLDLGNLGTNNINLTKQANNERSMIEKNYPFLDLYNTNISKVYPLATTTLGQTNAAKKPWYNLASIIYKALLVVLIGGTAIGTVQIIRLSKSKKIFKEYLPLVVVGLLAIATMVAVPYISQAYNFDRLYMQMYIFLAPVTIWGIFVSAKKFLRSKRLAILLCLLVVLLTFAYTKSLMWQYVGGKADMWLNNYGETFNVDYTHKGEVLSAQWLQNNAEPSQLIFTDIHGKNILTAYAETTISNNVIPTVFPAEVGTNSYVYLTYVNLNDEISLYESNSGAIIGYLYPQSFLQNSKNELYDNNGSAVYR